MMGKMMKRSAGIALLITFMVTGVALGQSIASLPDQGWWTSAGVQNVGEGEALLSVTAYPLHGVTGVEHTASPTITLGGAKTFLPGAGNTATTFDVSPALGDGFAGSMVVSSNEPLVAIGQVGNNELAFYGLGRTGGQASGMYNGANEGAPTITFPTVKHNFGGKTSTFYIQAAGNNVTVVATVQTNDGTNHTFNFTIDANKSVVVSMADFTPAIARTSCGEANTSPCVGALTAVATGGDIVGVALEADDTASPATRLQVATMFASTDGATAIYCPVFKNNWGGRYTGVTVQNVSGAPLNLNATFAGSLGDAAGIEYSSVITSVPNGASRTFHAYTDNVGGFPDASYGSVVITSTGNIIAQVNEANFAGTWFKATSYTCFAASKATTKVAFPQVKEDFGINTTGVSVQNIGVTTATLQAVYSCSDGNSYTHVAKDVGKGATYTYYKPYQVAANWTGTPMPLTGNLNCAVTVTAAQPLVGIGQEAAATGALDTKNYEAFNLAP
jgi:hypothetical protein